MRRSKTGTKNRISENTVLCPGYKPSMARKHQHHPKIKRNISLFRSFRWAVRGIKATFESQRNFRIQCSIFLITVLLGIFLHFALSEWLMILLSGFFVLAAEMINTAVEYLVDLYESRFNARAQLAKDIAAGFVLISAINASIVGLIVYGRRIVYLVKVVF